MRPNKKKKISQPLSENPISGDILKFERPGPTSVGWFQILSLPRILSSQVFMKADIICTNE